MVFKPSRRLTLWLASTSWRIYIHHLHYIRIFRRRFHHFQTQAHCSTSQVRLYTNSNRPTVDAMDSAEALARATVLRKDSSDGQQMEPHVRVADEVEQARIGEEGFREALRAEREDTHKSS